jgi:hypothetical protein
MPPLSIAISLILGTWCRCVTRCCAAYAPRVRPLSMSRPASESPGRLSTRPRQISNARVSPDCCRSNEGRTGPHKITDEVMAFIEAARAQEEGLDAQGLVERIAQHFGLAVPSAYRRARAGTQQKKNADETDGDDRWPDLGRGLRVLAARDRRVARGLSSLARACTLPVQRDGGLDALRGRNAPESGRRRSAPGVRGYDEFLREAEVEFFNVLKLIKTDSKTPINSLNHYENEDHDSDLQKVANDFLNKQKQNRYYGNDKNIKSSMQDDQKIVRDNALKLQNLNSKNVQKPILNPSSITFSKNTEKKKISVFDFVGQKENIEEASQEESYVDYNHEPSQKQYLNIDSTKEFESVERSIKEMYDAQTYDKNNDFSHIKQNLNFDSKDVEDKNQKEK